MNEDKVKFDTGNTNKLFTVQKRNLISVLTLLARHGLALNDIESIDVSRTDFCDKTTDYRMDINAIRNDENFVCTIKFFGKTNKKEQDEKEKK